MTFNTQQRKVITQPFGKFVDFGSGSNKFILKKNNSNKEAYIVVEGDLQRFVKLGILQRFVKQDVLQRLVKMFFIYHGRYSAESYQL